jgi:hypothetical protein
VALSAGATRASILSPCARPVEVGVGLLEKAHGEGAGAGPPALDHPERRDQREAGGALRHCHRIRLALDQLRIDAQGRRELGQHVLGEGAVVHIERARTLRHDGGDGFGRGIGERRQLFAVEGGDDLDGVEEAGPAGGLLDPGRPLPGDPLGGVVVVVDAVHEHDPHVRSPRTG